MHSFPPWRTTLLLVAVLALLPACAHRAPGSATVELFNGKDLDPFYTYLRDRGRDQDPNGVFTVQDGQLRISGEEWGCITTHDEYENYRLVTEFKWGEQTWAPREDKARDSGILLHSVGEDGGYSGIWMHSIECQIIEGGTGDFIVVGDGSPAYSITSSVNRTEPDKPHVYKQDGKLLTKTSGRVDWFARDAKWADQKGFYGLRDVERPVGEWNRLECIVRGDTIRIVLNGVVVNEAENVRPQRGRIQIQSEGAEIFFRKVELTPISTEPPSPPSSSRPYRFIYNSDANNMLLYAPYPMTPETYYPYIDELADSQITSLFVSPNLGMTVTYPTEVGDLIGEYASDELMKPLTPEAKPKTSERAIMNTYALIETGSDPIGIAIDRAKEKGLEAFVSWRLNDVHSVEEEDHLIFSRFWKEHPEWRFGEAGDPMPKVYHDIVGPNVSPIVSTWFPGCLDFAVPEVRAHRLAQLRECCERFNLDGLELDFQRFPMFFAAGKEVENIGIMTDWVRDVRAMMDEVGMKRGRPILLTARIPPRPEQSRGIGLDPVTWAKEGLIDFVVVAHFLRNDHPLHIEAYRDLFPPDFPVYGSIEVAWHKDGFRRVAHRLWQDGADGIALFNFPAQRQNDKEPFVDLFHELGATETIQEDDTP
jgi:hypothetical protein